MQVFCLILDFLNIRSGFLTHGISLRLVGWLQRVLQSRSAVETGWLVWMPFKHLNDMHGPFVILGSAKN